MSAREWRKHYLDGAMSTLTDPEWRKYYQDELTVLYIHKTLVKETQFVAITQLCSSATVSGFPNHTLNFPTDFYP